MNRRKQLARIQSLSDEEFEALTDIAFTIGEWLIRGTAHAANEERARREFEKMAEESRKEKKNEDSIKRE